MSQKTTPPEIQSAALLTSYEAAMRSACDLLAERTYGSAARSPGHNARLELESALKLNANAVRATPEPAPWQWWAGDNDERYNYGPHPTRQAAIDDALASIEPGTTLYVIEAREGRLTFDADLIVEALLDHNEESYSEYGEADRRGPAETIERADKELQALLDMWLDKHRDTFSTPTMFSASRNAEILAPEQPATADQVEA